MATRCHHCDYNLRGAKADRCPECGTPIDEYRARLKLAHRRLNRFYLWRLLPGVTMLVGALVLVLLEGRDLSVPVMVLLFFGAAWVLITAITWWMDGLESH